MDEELKEMVDDLQVKIQGKIGALHQLQSDVTNLQHSVQKRQKARDQYKSKLLTAEEVKPLCEETMKLKKSLTRMKDQVERIDQGTFDEYRKMQQLEDRSAALRSIAEQLSEDARQQLQNKSSIITRMKNEYEDRSKHVEELAKQLSKVQQQLEESRGNETSSGTRKGGHNHIDWDSKLDALVVKYCQKAGLQLQQN